MQSKSMGIALIIIGIIMIVYTGLNFVTSEKVVDLGSVEIIQKKDHLVQWPPIIGAVLILGGVVIMFRNKKVSL